MSITYYKQPLRRYIVTRGLAGTDYDIQAYTSKAVVTQLENAVDTATLLLADEYRDLYNNKIRTGDRLRIYWDYADRVGSADPPTLLVFDGYIDEPKTVLGEGGIFTEVTARSVGRSVLNMGCAQEYGLQSSNPTLHHIDTIIHDAGDGIIAKWVNEIRDTGVASGYALDHELETSTEEIQYIYFPYKPAKNCIDDLLELYQGLRGTSAGFHWIIPPDNHFYMGTIANHGGAVSGAWPTWLIGVNNLTLVQGVDFAEYSLEEQAAEANYIVYHGAFRKPGDGDFLTEDQHELWYGPQAGMLSDENGAGLFQVGSYSLKCVFTNAYNNSLLTADANSGQKVCSVVNGALFSAGDFVTIDDTDVTPENNQIDTIAVNDLTMVNNLGHTFTVAKSGYVEQNIGNTFSYPLNQAAHWQMDLWGGEYNIPELHFRLYTDTIYVPGGGGDTFVLDVVDNTGAYQQWDLVHHIKDDDQWIDITIPFGPYAPKRAAIGIQEDGWWSGGGVWTDVHYIRFVSSLAATVYIDGFSFNGHIIRIASQVAGYTVDDPCKMATVNDDVAKDDSGFTSDTSGAIACLAEAHFRRRKTKPIQGTVTLPNMLPTALSGQIVHIHAAKTATGTFRIDSTALNNFRIQRIDQIFDEKPRCILYVTSDIVNSIPMPPKDSYNILLNAIKPEYDTRESSSQKAREIDITQGVMVNTY